MPATIDSLDDATLYDELGDPITGPGRHPVEPKVRAATAAGGTAAGVFVPFALWLLGTYVFVGDVPLPVQGAVGFAVTGLCTFVAGYYARHVDRTLTA